MIVLEKIGDFFRPKDDAEWLALLEQNKCNFACSTDRHKRCTCHTCKEYNCYYQDGEMEERFLAAEIAQIKEIMSGEVGGKTPCQIAEIMGMKFMSWKCGGDRCNLNYSIS